MKQDKWLQSERDKMIWADKDLALVASIAMCIGFFIGWAV